MKTKVLPLILLIVFAASFAAFVTLASSAPMAEGNVDLTNSFGTGQIDYNLCDDPCGIPIDTPTGPT